MSATDRMRVALVVVLVLVMVLASGGTGFAAGWVLRPHAASAPIAPGDELQQRFGVFWEAWAIIDREFHRDAPLDTDKMIHGAISGMVRSLGDPYTVFVEPTLARIFEQNLEGSFEGIGATVDVVDGQLVIIEPLVDSPAFRAGLRARDVVLQADGRSLDGLELIQAIALIRGPKGTQVRLLIRRQGVAEPFEVAVIRERIELPTVKYRMLDDGIAYVRLTEFNSQATLRLQAALHDLLAKKPRAMIFDLRGNPGGYLHIAVQVASQFVREGVIVSERDGKGKSTDHLADGRGMAFDVPLVVLVDGGSASAAEIVAGAIRDSGRGILIGRRTLGKGSVQSSHTLSDGSALRVSIARWYTPKGHLLDGYGLAPDIVVPADPAAPADSDPILESAVRHLSPKPQSITNRM